MLRLVVIYCILLSGLVILMVMTEQREAQASPGEVTYYYHNDHLMTTMFMSDEAGEVVWTMSQTPFDEQHVNTDPDGDGTTVTNRFRFPGQYSDGETDSMAWYNWNRFYVPSLGRYNRVDPILVDVSKFLLLSSPDYAYVFYTYSYGVNNPTHSFDNAGLASAKSGDCVRMRTQEKLTQSYWNKSLNCNQAYLTCKNNCKIYNSCTEIKSDFYRKLCDDECDQRKGPCRSWLHNVGFRFPPMLWNHCDDDPCNDGCLSGQGC